MTNQLSSARVLRALSRFDGVTVEEMSVALSQYRRNVRGRLEFLVTSGLAHREGGPKCTAKYTITEAGKASLREAA